MRKKRLLLVSPAFHNYHRGIAAAFQALGFEVITHIYDQANSNLDRLKNRLALDAQNPGAAAILKSLSRKAVDLLSTSAPDLVVVVKGDILTEDWWEALAELGVPYWLWIYDELGNTKFDIDFLKSLPYVASYSKADTQRLRDSGIQAAFVPGGFDAAEAFTPNPSVAGLVTFTGARYPTRERILSSLATQGVQVKAFGREWSRLPLDIVRTRRWRSVGFETGPDLTRSESYGVMAGSLASINHHGGHSGFNMRLFEACGVAGVHFVDRIDVADFYDIGTEVLTFSSSEEVVELLARLRSDPAMADRIRHSARKRTLAGHTLRHRMADLLEMRDYGKANQGE
jgi:spore maturation protein CgeB